MPIINLQGIANNVRFLLVLVTLVHGRFTIPIATQIEVACGDTKSKI